MNLFGSPTKRKIPPSQIDALADKKTQKSDQQFTQAEEFSVATSRNYHIKWH